jgi:glycosyltransferase involved in cell wall biosynthesis
VAPRFARAREGVEWLGPVDLPSKVRLLGGACALLFPVDWEEPFGLVMIESMLVGTPVIAFPRGSVPEIVEEGITGFVVKDGREMVARLRTLGGFDRARCRSRAIERWGAARMAREYEHVYVETVRQRLPSRALTPGGFSARAPGWEESWPSPK